VSPPAKYDDGTAPLTFRVDEEARRAVDWLTVHLRAPSPGALARAALLDVLEAHGLDVDDRGAWRLPRASS
jgi:hypothetical protein